MANSQTVAYAKFAGVLGSGEHIIVEATVGLPYRRSEDEWACPISLTPLHAKLHDIVGADSLQALCLGLSTLFQLLNGFVESGGRLELASGDPVPFEAYWRKGGSDAV